MGVITGSGASSRIGYDELTGFGSEAGSSRLGKLLQSVALFFQALMPGGDNTMTTTVVKPRRANQPPAEKKVKMIKFKVVEINNKTFYPSGAYDYREYDTLISRKGLSSFRKITKEKGDSVVRVLN